MLVYHEGCKQHAWLVIFLTGVISPCCFSKKGSSDYKYEFKKKKIVMVFFSFVNEYMDNILHMPSVSENGAIWD